MHNFNKSLNSNININFTEHLSFPITQYQFQEITLGGVHFKNEFLCSFFSECFLKFSDPTLRRTSIGDALGKDYLVSPCLLLGGTYPNRCTISHPFVLKRL